MIVILLSGKEWVLRHPFGNDLDIHYTQRRCANRSEPIVVPLCRPESSLGPRAEPVTSAVETEQICRKCWTIAMTRSAAEAKARASEIWKGSGAKLLKATKRGAGLVRK